MNKDFIDLTIEFLNGFKPALYGNNGKFFACRTANELLSKRKIPGKIYYSPTHDLFYYEPQR